MLNAQCSSAKAELMRRQGFTLIELSIVLVIIGLIAGGILVGQDLIRAAQMRQQLAQINSLNVAVNTFRLKYNCLPGDCKNVTQFFGASSQPDQVTNGNGNGVISSGYDVYDHNMSWGLTGEWSSAMDHLSAAKLIDLPQFDETDATVTVVPGLGFPKVKFSSVGEVNVGNQPWGATTTDSFDSPGGIVFGYQPAMTYSPWHVSGHVFRFGAKHYERTGWSPSLGFALGYNPWDAQMMDEKLDDGKPYSGIMTVGDFDKNDVGLFPTRAQGWFGNYNAGLCGVWATNVYRSKSNMVAERVCYISLKASF